MMLQRLVDLERMTKQVKTSFQNTSYVSAVFRKVYLKHKCKQLISAFVSEYYNFYIPWELFHYVLFYYCVQFYAWREKLTLSH